METNCVSLNSYMDFLSLEIRSRRQLAQISQEELAQRAGLHRTYISDVERGARNLSLKTLLRLCRALDLTPSAVLLSIESRAISELANPCPPGQICISCRIDPKDEQLPPSL